MGPKTLPTIWGTYMKLVNKYQISAINSYWEKCDDKYFGWTKDGQTDRGKTLYLPPPSGSGGIIKGGHESVMQLNVIIMNALTAWIKHQSAY